jgi:hypothetical protein
MVQNLNLRHVYLKRFLIFRAVPLFARLASKFEKVQYDLKQFFGKIHKRYQKPQNFMLISNQLKKFLNNAPKKL